MQKILIIILVLLGLTLGYWLSRQNQKLFELPIPESQFQQGMRADQTGPKAVEIGMDMWEVKEILGEPDKRIVISDKAGDKREAWFYKGKNIYFSNGFMTHREDV
jgi:outer membrane protein assembly factor BamE (lipoprotein component of BamABCDE complex)